MNGPLILAFVSVHIVGWLIQIWRNQANGGKDCEDILNFACGGPLEKFFQAANVFSGVEGIGSLTIAIGQSVITFLLGFVELAFFNYDWLSGGGQITDVFSVLLKLGMAAIFFGVMGKIILGVILGRGIA